MYTTLTTTLPKLAQQGPAVSIVDFCWQTSLATPPQSQGGSVPIFGEDWTEIPLT